MSRKYKMVRTLPELVSEIGHNTDALHRKTRWLTFGLVVCGIELVLASRLITKQEEAICDLTSRVRKLERPDENVSEKDDADTEDADG